MSQNYPELPKSPIPDLSSQKKPTPPPVKAPIRKSPPSPLTKSSELRKTKKENEEDEEEKVDDFDKYEVKRAAVGTGIFSSMLTLSLVSKF